MTFLFLSVIASISLNLFPRYDGVVVEVIGTSLLKPVVQTSGYTVRLDFAEQVLFNENTLIPIWVNNFLIDSLGFTVEFDPSIASVDWALSGDSMSMILFARAEEQILLPPVSWQAPPPFEPDTALWSDSLVFAALERGEGSPWLVDFDCIVLDPGHGGRDPGAVGPTGSREKDRTLEISLMVRDILRIRKPELRIVLTRSVDEYVSLGARTRMANRNQADLFVSLHCNAAENRSANGFETYFLSRARTDDARAVQMLENNSLDLDDISSVPEDPLFFLLADMAQSVFQNQSSHLAGSIQSHLGNAFPMRINRGVKRAGFFVLRGAYMPAVLIEVGFISNITEEDKLKSLDFRFKAAQAIVESIIEYAEREI